MGDHFHTGDLPTTLRNVGAKLEDGWTVGPVDPETGKETDFMMYPLTAEWQDAMFAAGVMRVIEKHRNARLLSCAYAGALQASTRKEIKRDEAKPITDMLRGKPFWRSDESVVPRLAYVEDIPGYLISKQSKNMEAHILITRDAPERVP